MNRHVFYTPPDITLDVYLESKLDEFYTQREPQPHEHFEFRNLDGEVFLVSTSDALHYPQITLTAHCLFALASDAPPTVLLPYASIDQASTWLVDECSNWARRFEFTAPRTIRCSGGAPTNIQTLNNLTPTWETTFLVRIEFSG